MAQETIQWKLFPFSLAEKAKQWYTHNVGKVNGEWEELRNRFGLAFFPISRIASLRKEILDFRQDEKETLGAAWARFTQLTHDYPDLSIPDHVLLQHFCLGLNNETALQLDITVGGSFAYKTTSELIALLDRILEKTSFIEPLPVVKPSSHEEILVAEPTSSQLSRLDSLAEPSPEPETLEEDEILPLEFSWNIEEDIFNVFGITTLYPLQKRPPVPIDPPNNFDKASLKETMKGIAAVMHSEWLQEGEASS